MDSANSERPDVSNFAYSNSVVTGDNYFSFVQVGNLFIDVKNEGLNTSAITLEVQGIKNKLQIKLDDIISGQGIIPDPEGSQKCGPLEPCSGKVTGNQGMSQNKRPGFKLPQETTTDNKPIDKAKSGWLFFILLLILFLGAVGWVVYMNLKKNGEEEDAGSDDEDENRYTSIEPESNVTVDKAKDTINNEEGLTI